MSVCCSRIVKDIFSHAGILDREESPITKNELSKRLGQEAEIWKKEDRTNFWSRFTQNGHAGIPCHIEESIDSFASKPGVAVELGCGNSSVVELLLKRGWKVEAVDNSRNVLTQLQQRISQTLADRIENLTLVQADMEAYQFPNDAKLIIAKDSLPYCDPDKIVEVWDRAHDSLEDGGRIAGNFFPYPCNKQAETIHRNLMGAWFTDKAVVQALLDEKSYNTEVCEYSKPRYRELFFDEPRQINFAAQKPS